MAFDALRKELQRAVLTCCPACPAEALSEGGKTLLLSAQREGALTILRSFEITSVLKLLYCKMPVGPAANKKGENLCLKSIGSS